MIISLYLSKYTMLRSHKIIFSKDSLSKILMNGILIVNTSDFIMYTGVIQSEFLNLLSINILLVRFEQISDSFEVDANQTGKHLLRFCLKKGFINEESILVMGKGIEFNRIIFMGSMERNDNNFIIECKPNHSICCFYAMLSLPYIINKIILIAVAFTLKEKVLLNLTPDIISLNTTIFIYVPDYYVNDLERINEIVQYVNNILLFEHELSLKFEIIRSNSKFICKTIRKINNENHIDFSYNNNVCLKFDSMDHLKKVDSMLKGDIKIEDLDMRLTFNNHYFSLAGRLSIKNTNTVFDRLYNIDLNLLNLDFVDQMTMREIMSILKSIILKNIPIN